jgi:hypothetical protein
MKDRVFFDVLFFTIYFHFICMTISVFVLMELNVKMYKIDIL